MSEASDGLWRLAIPSKAAGSTKKQPSTVLHVKTWVYPKA